MSETNSTIRSLLEALAAGLLFGLLGFACATAIFWKAQGGGWEAFPACAGVAALMTGFASWWLIVASPGNHSLGRGLWAGALVGILSHPLAWYLAILVNYLSGAEPAVDEAMDPLRGLWGSVVFSIGSWACVGWLTVPLGALAGAGISSVMRWLSGKGS